ncbi:hypothetical protein SUGI_0375910 [Cryptomeria japonica]|uniref:GRAS family protein RAM1-like n=1 Tax=Cryptomeria japonica TaxID=3369 RepID=UPI0024089418|nr:GRAS family protein RAM1-like [Cryptomeria japonica]GLJ20643.1 hypothetical protein SUGI_0375910 [Cryptomeria japonica]
MVATDNGTHPLSPSDCSVNPFLWEADGPELDEHPVIATDDSFALLNNEMLRSGEEPVSHSLFEIFDFNEEIINSDMMSGQFEDFSEPENLHVAADNSLHGEQIYNEIPPKLCDQIMNFQGGNGVGTSINNGLDCGVNLSGEEEERVQLVQLVLASGEMIGNEEYDDAALLVSKCKKLSSQLGSPTQRLVYYISDALQQRIQRNTLGISNNAAKPVSNLAFEIDSLFDVNEFSVLAAYYNSVLPYIKLLQFTSVQAIIDAVGNEKRIHVIDLAMRTGSQWTVLMEFLAHRAATSTTSRRQFLKITVVGRNGEELRKIGKRLEELAKSLDIPFSYKMVEIQNLEEIKEGLFTVKSSEALAVYAPIILRSLLYDPVLLVDVLCIFKKLKPRIMVAVEVEAKHNSSCFVNRLREVLYNYCAFFDMLDVIFPDRNDIKRVKYEELLEGNQIRNILVFEGKERTIRHVTSDVWRVFFTEAGFKEMSFSFHALYQARLLLKEYVSGQYYTLQPDGHAIIVRWKGTPLMAVSAWTVIK